MGCKSKEIFFLVFVMFIYEDWKGEIWYKWYLELSFSFKYWNGFVGFGCLGILKKKIVLNLK